MYVWVLVNIKLNVSQKWALVTKKSDGILDSIRMILPLYSSLVKHIWKSVLGSTVQEKHGASPATGHQDDTRLKHLTYKERLKETGFSSLEKRRLRTEDRARLFLGESSGRMRENRYKLKYRKLHLNTQPLNHPHPFFTVRVVKPWHSSLRKVVESPFLQIFKTKLDAALATCSS